MSISNGLDPARLTPVASLNRVRFVELPGLALPTDMVGRTAYELLSARALADLARPYAGALELAEGEAAEGPSIFESLDRGFGDESSPAHAAADLVARRFGERLGWLIVTLRRGDAVSRAARPDWDDSYWRHWAGITTVYLAGGIPSGRIGPRLAEQASSILATVGLAACSVRVAPWPAILPLIGAASLPLSIGMGLPGWLGGGACSTTIVLDFGQSLVKRGCAEYEPGARDQARSLSRLRVFPPVPARWSVLPSDPASMAEHAERLGNSMVTTMVETWRAAQAITGDVSETIVASFASYIRDGQPLARQGGPYAELKALSDNLERRLSDRVSQDIGCSLTVRLLHDGSAAAQALAGEEHAAVMMLGTALGVGFPPASVLSCSLSPRFTVTDAVLA